MEQIRVIKEMREKDAQSGRTGRDIRPRFMVWENVASSFSVNGGRDFAVILQETIRVVEPTAPDIHVPKNGWTNAGAVVGRCWSVAWRVLDAQFWGVPQRRRRIALIADFGDRCATEILFKPDGSSWYLKPSEAQGKRTAGDSANSSGTAGGDNSGRDSDGRTGDRAGGCLNPDDPQSKRVFTTDGVAPTLASGTTEGMNIVPSVLVEPTVFENHDQDTCFDKRNGNPIVLESSQNHATITDSGIVPTLTASMGCGGGYVPMIVDTTHADSVVRYGDISPSLQARDYKGGINVLCELD